MHEECFRGAVEANYSDILVSRLSHSEIVQLQCSRSGRWEPGDEANIYWVSGWHRLSGLVNLCMFLNHSQSSHHSYHHLQYKYIAGLEFGPGSNNRGVTVCPLVHCIHKQLSVIVGGGMLHCYGDTNTKIKIYQSI